MHCGSFEACACPKVQCSSASSVLLYIIEIPAFSAISISNLVIHLIEYPNAVLDEFIFLMFSDTSNYFFNLFTKTISVVLHLGEFIFELVEGIYQCLSIHDHNSCCRWIRMNYLSFTASILEVIDSSYALIQSLCQKTKVELRYRRVFIGLRGFELTDIINQIHFC